MSAVEEEMPKNEQPRVTEAQSISPPTRVLAQQLGETKFHALQQLERCILVLGEATVDELLRETEQIEQGAGLLTQDGKRRRTKGGVFLYLARGRCTPDQRAIVFPLTEWQARKAARKARATPHRARRTRPAATPCSTRQGHLFFPGSSDVENDPQRPPRFSPPSRTATCDSCLSAPRRRIFSGRYPSSAQRAAARHGVRGEKTVGQGGGRATAADDQPDS